MENANSVEKLLTLQQVAELLRVHVNTVRRWTDQGLIPSYSLGPRGIRRFRQRDLEAFISQHERHPQRDWAAE